MKARALPSVAILVVWLLWPARPLGTLAAWPADPPRPPANWYRQPCNLVISPPPDGCPATAWPALPAGIPAPCVAFADVHAPDPLDAEEFAAVLVIWIDHPEIPAYETVELTQDHAGKWEIWPDWWDTDCGLNEAPLAAATAAALNSHSLAAFSGYTTPLPPEFLSLIRSLAGIPDLPYRLYLPLVISPPADLADPPAFTGIITPPAPVQLWLSVRGEARLLATIQPTQPAFTVPLPCPEPPDPLLPDWYALVAPGYVAACSNGIGVAEGDTIIYPPGLCYRSWPGNLFTLPEPPAPSLATPADLAGRKAWPAPSLATPADLAGRKAWPAPQPGYARQRTRHRTRPAWLFRASPRARTHTRAHTPAHPRRP